MTALMEASAAAGGALSRVAVLGMMDVPRLAVLVNDNSNTQAV
jgi:hypothetical protein